MIDPQGMYPPLFSLNNLVDVPSTRTDPHEMYPLLFLVNNPSRCTLYLYHKGCTLQCVKTKEESKEFSDCVILNSLTREKRDTKELRRLVLRSFAKGRRETQKEFRRKKKKEFKEIQKSIGKSKNPADTMPFDRKITKTERKNRKKKKQATTRTSAERGGEGNRPPRRRTLGDYAYQQGPKHYNSIVIPSFSNKGVELKPALLSLIGSHLFAEMDHEDPYTHLSAFMELCSKAKTWLQSHPNKCLNTWEEVEEKFIARFFPPSRFISVKFSIVMFSQGSDELLCETWERFKALLTMMSKSLEEAIVIIDSIAASGSQKTHQAHQVQQILRCDLCGGNHQNGHCLRPGDGQQEEEAHYFQNQARPQQNIQGSYQGYRGGSGSNQPYGWRLQNSGPTNTSFVSIANQKNTDASIKSKSSTSTHVNPKEHCNLITTRWGTVVGLKDNNEKKNKEGIEKENEINDEVVTSEKVVIEEEKNKSNEQTTDKVKAIVNIHQLSIFLIRILRQRKIRKGSTNILKQLHINIPFSEALEQMPTYAKFMKDLLMKKKIIMDGEIEKPQPQQ
ncbi:hypothetical protein HKD37_19G053348 [Glycine soja]